MSEKGKTIKNYFVYNIYNIRVKNWRAYMGLALFPLLKFDSVTEFLSHLTDIIVLIISISIYLAFAFGINNYYDRKEDVEEGDVKKNLIAFGKLSPKDALSFLVIITLAGITFVFIYTQDLLIWALYVSLIFFAWIYSAYPIRLKTRAGLDILSHGLYFGSVIFAYSYLLLFRNELFELLYNPLLYLIFLYSISLEMRNEVEDFDFDKTAGLKTTATVLGKNRAVRFIFSVLLLHWIIPPIYAYVCLSNIFVTAIFGVITVIVLVSATMTNNFKWYRINDVAVILFYILFILTLKYV